MLKTLAFLLASLPIVAAADTPHFVTYKMENYTTMFAVVTPEGAQCHVKSDSSWFGEKDFEVPFKFKAQANYYYTFDCKLPSGETWHKRLEPKANHTNIVKVGVDGPTAAVSSTTPTSRGTKKAMAMADFRKLITEIKKADFEDDQLSVVEMASKLSYFTSEQVGQLVDVITFEDAKVKVVEFTAKRIVDPKKSYAILGHFTFSEGKDEAKKILTKAGSR